MWHLDVLAATTSFVTEGNQYTNVKNYVPRTPIVKRSSMESAMEVQRKSTKPGTVNSITATTVQGVMAWLTTLTFMFKQDVHHLVSWLIIFLFIP